MRPFVWPRGLLAFAFVGMIIGTAIGTSMGTAMGNLTLGVAMGPGLGITLGLALYAVAKAGRAGKDDRAASSDIPIE